jgi:signal transduction histidine kinase
VPRVLVESAADASAALRQGGCGRLMRLVLSSGRGQGGRGVACKWRIRRKLMLGLALVFAITALLLAGTLKGLLSYRATIGAATSRLNELRAADEIRTAVKALGAVLDSRDFPGETSSPIELLRKRSEEAKKCLEEYELKLQETIVHGHDPGKGFREKDQIEGLKQGFQELDKAIKECPQANVGSNEPLPIWDKNSPVNWAVTKLTSASDDLSSAIYGDLREWFKGSKTDYKLALIIVLSTMTVGVIMMISLLRFFYRWVFYPIRDLQQGVGRVAEGDFEHAIQIKSGDEIEDLANAFNDMTGRLRDMYRDLARQVNERSRQLVRSERLAGVGFLAAGVAHEINNPLASIAFCSEALERRLADFLDRRPILGRGQDDVAQERDIIAKYLKMIQEEAFRCKEITQRLLEFSRGGERRREPTDIGELVQGVLDMVQHLQNCKGKELVFQQVERLTAWVNAQEIKSVVLNLVVNALDSMDEGGTLTITQRNKDGMVELVFQDSGCGMTPEVLENIFEPFFTRSRTGKGTGLGLSISHRIINQHGGEIEAVSAGLNQGSTFTVHLPLQPVDEVRETENVGPVVRQAA